MPRPWPTIARLRSPAARRLCRTGSASGPARKRLFGSPTKACTNLAELRNSLTIISDNSVAGSVKSDFLVGPAPTLEAVNMLYRIILPFKAWSARKRVRQQLRQIEVLAFPKTNYWTLRQAS